MQQAIKFFLLASVSPDTQLRLGDSVSRQLRNRHSWGIVGGWPEVRLPQAAESKGWKKDVRNEYWK